VLDKNLELITADGAADIMNLPAEGARGLWIQMIKSRK
jgi:hypothetical protein